MVVICVPVICFSQETVKRQVSPMSGMYEGDRKVWIDEHGELKYQRTGAPIALKLVHIKETLYELAVPAGVRTPREIPKIQFVKNDNKEITALELVFKDGEIEGPYKKVSK